MQALTFAVEYPNFADTIIPMATTYSATPWVIAFNKVAQSAITNDSLFKNGNYDAQEIKEFGFGGFSTARMTGYLTYLSPETMKKKFDRNYTSNDGLFELFGRFEIERYLDYNGNNFTKWFDPLSFLYITKAINIFDLSRGYDNISDALSRIQSKLHLISFKRDMLFFPSEMEEIYNIMKSNNQNNMSYYMVDSDYGHDAFLVEVDKFADYILEVMK